MFSVVASSLKNRDNMATIPSHASCMIIIPPVASINAINIVAFEAVMLAKSEAHSASSRSPSRDIPSLHIPAHPASSSTLCITLISSFISSSQLPSE